jgi:hypothetical protein
MRVKFTMIKPYGGAAVARGRVRGIAQACGTLTG